MQLNPILAGEQAVFNKDTPIITPNIETYFSQSLQSNSNMGLGMFNPAWNAFAAAPEEKELAQSVHYTDRDNLFIIPASPVLGEILHQLESKHKILKLKEGLKQLSPNFDRVYIDTPPAFNFFTLSALIAADRVIVPFDCDVFSKRALQTLLGNIVETRQDHNRQLFVEGIVVNQYDSRANLPKEVVQSLLDDGLPVFDSKLSSSVIMKESHQKNQPLIYLDSKHKLSQQFVDLYEEIEAD